MKSTSLALPIYDILFINVKINSSEYVYVGFQVEMFIWQFFLFIHMILRNFNKDIPW